MEKKKQVSASCLHTIFVHRFYCLFANSLPSKVGLLQNSPTKPLLQSSLSFRLHSGFPISYCFFPQFVCSFCSFFPGFRFSYLVPFSIMLLLILYLFYSSHCMPFYCSRLNFLFFPILYIFHIFHIFHIFRTFRIFRVFRISLFSLFSSLFFL